MVPILYYYNIYIYGQIHILLHSYTQCNNIIRTVTNFRVEVTKQKLGCCVWGRRDDVWCRKTVIYLTTACMVNIIIYNYYSTTCYYREIWVESPPFAMGDLSSRARTTLQREMRIDEHIYIYTVATKIFFFQTVAPERVIKINIYIWRVCICVLVRRTQYRKTIGWCGGKLAALMVYILYSLQGYTNYTRKYIQRW